jgi:acyl carrier protein
MSAVSEHELVDLVVGWVRKNSRLTEAIPVDIKPGTDLISSGLLDSLGFVNLIMYIESQSGCKVDLIEADLGDCTVVEDLCRVALRAHP